MKTTLAQWRALQAVVDEGGFAQASRVLNRSQSSVSYAISRLEDSLGIPLLTLSGRKARLTDAGEVLLRGARNLLGEAGELEALAGTLAEGWEAELSLAVDGICPGSVLLEALHAFARAAPGTRVEVFEEVLSGAPEAVETGRVDLALSPITPAGYLGEPLLDIEFLPVAHPDHPLHRLDRPLAGDDLSRELQIVIRDSARRARQDSGWLGSPRRWTVSTLATARAMVAGGTGFAWLPAHMAAPAIRRGELARLPIQGAGGKRSHLYLVHARPHGMGPGARLLSDCLRRAFADAGEPADGF